MIDRMGIAISPRGDMPKHRIRSNLYGCTMSSFNTISAEKLARLIGTPKCPAAHRCAHRRGFCERSAPDSRLHQRRPFETVADWAHELAGRAVSRDLPERARSSAMAWRPGCAMRAFPPTRSKAERWLGRKPGLPMVPADRIPPPDPQGRTIWVTRSRPKIDRIACPWLIRRFVDPDCRFPVRPHVRKSRAWRSGFQPTPFDIEGEDIFWTPSRRALHLRCHGGGVRPCHGASEAARHHRQRRRYGAARSGAGGAWAAGGLSGIVTHVCGRPRAARSRAFALRCLLPLVP